tara:strand:+ start:12595 stop:14781 length:2187 start_codon:yes stop_codon:yes gene_type:complete
MATTQNTYTGDGSTTNYSFTFPYLAETDVKVKLNGTTQATTTYSFANATTISMNTAPANGVSIIIFRDTNNDSKKATFYPGSAIKAEDLNNDFDQILYTAQEVDNNSMSTLGDDPMQGDLSLGNNKITNLATPTAATDGASKGYVDTTAANLIDTAMEGDVLAGTDLAKTASGGQVTINHSVSGANTTVDNSNGNVLQDITVTAQGHVTSVGSVDLDTRYYTETELNAGQLDNRYYTETEVDANFYKLGSVAEIQSGESWSAADNKIATTAAIDARITDLVDDVGGFVPIANETSFPNANPDVNNGAGTLISVKALASNLTSNGSGVATIANGNVANDATITINGLANSTTYSAGYGLIVETTSTLHTYTFHRQTPIATEVTAVASNISNINTVAGNETNINTVAGANSNITTVAGAVSNVNAVGGSIANVNTVATNISSVNDFSDVYRIASSAPTSHLHEGDLYFNTTSNELQIYNGSAWQGGVTATGNLVAKAGDTLTGNLILDNEKELRLSENDSNGANFIAIKAPAAVTSDTTLTLPDGAGSSGQTLTTDGSGTLSWSAIGNAATATKLASPVNINSVAFDGSAAITVAAAAGTLTGATLASGVTASSLTSTGTLTTLTIDGPYKQVSEAVSALDIDCSTGNYFTKTINANSTFTFSNPASSGTVSSFTLELTHTSGVVTWPTSVKWNGDEAPTLTTGKTHLLMFVTDDGGTRWRGAALVDYVN